VAAAVAQTPPSAPPEQRVLLHGVTWKEYCAIRELLDSPRMTYLGGALEIMVPSLEHELWKKNIARFVELYALVADVDLYGYGGMTFKNEMHERGCEPDECYVVGNKLAQYPQIVLEVIHTNPLLNKLDVYAAMGVAEVWVFKEGAFHLHLLDAGAKAYRAVRRSALLPELDFEALARYAVRTDTPQALREFKREIEAKRA
jgi:Uma2 family endonuclease